MIERRLFSKLAGDDRGWLKAKHRFAFGERADATRMGWGSLRVWKSRPNRRTGALDVKSRAPD
jgi:hypothetical protein